MSADRPIQFSDLMSPESNGIGHERILTEEALSLLKGTLKLHPEIRMHTSEDPKEVLKGLSGVNEEDRFFDVFKGIFGQSSVHVLTRVREDLGQYVSRAFGGKTPEELGEYYSDNPQVAEQHFEVREKAAQILDNFIDRLEAAKEAESILSSGRSTD